MLFVLFFTGCPNPMDEVETPEDGEETGADTAPPTLSLNGASEPYLIQGSSWTDPGAAADDDVDGDISANIVTGGDTVDTSAIGTYVITYNVSDTAGNAAAEATRTVEVVHPIDARNYEFELQWGSFRLQPGIMTAPYGLAFASDGKLLVSDGDSSRVQAFLPDGSFSEVIYQGRSTIGGISTNEAGDIYMGMVFGDEIVKLNSSGQIILRWGSSGSGNGQFSMPYGAVEVDGVIYVIDNGNNRIQTFNTGGNYTGQWGGSGTGNGQFNGPAGIAVAGDYVYVTDSGNNRIQKFNKSGVFQSAWGTAGSGENQYSSPAGIWYDGTNLLIADQYNHRFQITTVDGTFVGEFGTNGSGNGEFEAPFSAITDGAGNIYCGDLDNERVQKLNSAYAYITDFGSGDFSSNGKFDYPLGICLDGSSRLYVADGNNARVQIFDGEGSYIDKWTGFNGFVSDVAYDPATDSIYVANHNPDRTIQRFNTSGVQQDIFGGPGTGDGQFQDTSSNALYVAVDSASNVYVLESGYNRIQKFDASGNHVLSWGNPGTTGSSPGSLDGPTAIAVDGDDTIWISDESRFVLIQYSNSGTYLQELEYHPAGAVSFDANGNMWWGGYDGPDGNPIMAKMDTELYGMAMLYSSGADDTAPWYTQESAVDSAGNLYVLDLANYIIQKFKPVDGIMELP